jgi:outer membrane protein TolC
VKLSLLASFILLTPVLVAAQEGPLTIDRAVQLAVTRNERGAIADTVAEAADARVSRARTALFPRIDVTGQYRNDSAADTRNQLTASALVTQPLFDARVFPLMRQARLERDAARLSATEQKRLVGFDAANAFVTALSLENVLLAAANRREFARTSLIDVRARFEAGLVSSNDVTRAELEMATAERGVVQAGGNVEDAVLELENLVNAKVDGPLQTPEALLAAAATAPAVDDDVVNAATDRRSDIAATRARVEALRAFAEEPRLRFIPSVTLNAQSRNINEGPITDRQNEGFVGMTLNWSAFDAGLRNAETAERNALVRGAELQLELARRDVERQMRGAAVALTTEQAALREAAAALRAARRNAEETNELYRQGLASALELADANRQLFEAEVAEVTARFRMAVAYLALREARGEGVVNE